MKRFGCRSASHDARHFAKGARIRLGVFEWHREDGGAAVLAIFSILRGVRLKSGKTLASNSFFDSFVPAFVLL